jgi:PAS domain S-box-containing protein
MLPTFQYSFLRRATVAISVVLIALLITTQVEVLATRMPFALFFAAVAFAAWIGGRLIGLAALALSIAASGYYVIPFAQDPTALFQLGTFAFVGLLIAFLTARLRVGQDLIRESEARYRILFDYSPYGILIADRDSNYVDANEKMSEMLGYSREELIGMHGTDIVAPHETPQIDAALQTLRSGTDYNREWAFRRKDNSQFVGEVMATQMPDGTLLGVVRDVTERELAEARFRQLIEGAPNGMVMVDQSGTIQLVNTEIEKLFGYGREELLGQKIEMLVPDRFRVHHEQYRKDFVTAASARPMGSGRDLFALRKDSTEFPVEIGLNPIKTDAGMVILGTIVDITERKRAEESLRRSQERLKAVVDTALDGIIMMDHEGRIAGFNPSAERIFNYRSSDVIGQNLAEKIIPPDYREAHRRGLERFLATGEGPVLNKRLELTAMKADGYEIPVELTISRVGMTEPPLFTAFVRDITDRKRAEETLRRSQQQLAGIIDSAMDAIITVNEEQEIVLFNSAAEKMFQYPADEAVGKSLERFIPERFRHAHKGHIQTFGKTAVTRRSMASLGAIFGVRADGEEFPIEASISQLEAEGKKFFTVILRDITERKVAEQKLLESQNQFQELTESIPQMVWTCRGDGTCDYLSPQWLDYTGLPADEQLGFGWLNQVHPDDRERTIREWNKAVECVGVYDIEFRIRRFDGAFRWFKTLAVPSKDSEGTIVKWIGSNTDIEDSKEAEEQIRDFNETLENRIAERTTELELANKELEAFSYSVSHDLRAPLRHIDGFVKLLADREAERFDETSSRYLNVVADSVEKMGVLIDELLAFSRTSRREIKAARVDLNDLVKESLQMLETSIDGRPIEWRLEPLPDVLGDPTLLGLVFSNLLSNAVKFTRDCNPAKIEVGSMDEKNGQVTIYVKDNGVGFDMAYTKKLFGVFQRLHRDDEFEGIGIGLATVQRIVNRHGGRVWADAEVDKGATFYFALKKAD